MAELALSMDREGAEIMWRTGVEKRLLKAIDRGWELARAAPSTRGWLGCAIGPGEWLMIADGSAPRAALAPGYDEGQGLLIADMSSGYQAIAVFGGQARALLAKGVAIDLQAPGFGTGSTVVCRLGAYRIILRQSGIDQYELYVERSHADRLVSHLLDLGREFGAILAASHDARSAD